VESVSAENLQDYFCKYFVPNRTVISIVGNVHKKDVIDKVGDLFGNLKPWTAQRVPIPWEPKPEENYLPLSSGSSLAWLLIGFPAPSYGTDDYAGMRVLYSLLGEGLSCRFWMEVREKRGLSYEIGGMYPVLNGPCHVASYFITSPGQVNQVRKAMMGEIRRIRSERVSPDELEGTKRKVLGKFLLERDTRNGLAAALGAAEVLGVGYQYDQTFPSLVQKVTDSDILYLAREYLENYTLIIARPAGEFYFE
jgi:predicted Zn-dependent peptidase